MTEWGSQTCGDCGNLGDLTISKGTREKDGSCCFCTGTAPVVHILSGNHLQVRLCNACLKLVKQYKG